MARKHGLVFGVLVGAFGVLLGFSSPAQSQRAMRAVEVTQSSAPVEVITLTRPKPETLAQRLAKSAKLSEEDAKKFMTALGPVVRDDLQQGRDVTLEGLGTFRVVRIPEHNDLRDGRPVTIAAVNQVEFIPEGELNASANSPTAQPAETVPPFQYNTLPGQTPGQKTGRTRTPQIRMK